MDEARHIPKLADPDRHLDQCKVSWVIENITKESSLIRLAEAVHQCGSELFEINGDYSKQTIEALRKYASTRTVIFDGSINMAELVTNDVPAILTIGTPPHYFCSCYYPKNIGLLFNDRYTILPTSGITQQSIQQFAVDGCVFIRPDAGQKQFHARLIQLSEVANVTRYGEFAVLISSPKNITGEWRFLCDGSGIVAMSSYRINGQPVFAPQAPEGAIRICEQVVHRYQPDRLFVVDVCADNDGAFWLLELNQFTGAGLYACDKTAAVRAAERVARGLSSRRPVKQLE